MSRIGQQTIELPSGVTARIEGSIITVEGPHGSVSLSVPPAIRVQEQEGKLAVAPTRPDDPATRALWGTIRARIANLVEGVSKGFTKRLEVQGVGYRAALQGDTLVLQLGFSHPVEVRAPEGIQFAVEKNVIIVSGIDKVLVGETAARVRRLKKPEPYKGKGIRYVGEVVRRKAGKKAVSSA
jgi:large subunit ribosomal protein L6